MGSAGDLRETLSMHNERGGRGRRSILTALILVLVPVLAMLGVTPNPSGTSSVYAAPGEPSGSVTDADTIAFINEQIKKQWTDNQITPSANASDYEWCRRVYLDIIGRIPAVDELERFVSRSKPSAKTSKSDLVTALLKDEDYAHNWANLWTVWLLTRTNQPGIDRQKMRGWLMDQFAQRDMCYDKMVEELLTATGKTNENGAANFITAHVGERAGNRARDGLYEMVPATSRTARLFLGIQVQCTQCHNHPSLDSRKQQQFWGINAFLRQVQREPDMINAQRNVQAGQYYELKDNLTLNPSGGIFYDVRNGTLAWASSRYLDGTKLEIDENNPVNRRQELAKLIIKDEYFAKAIVNRMWGHFMGRGFTHPVDDFNEQNAVSHPELLDRLAKDFAASNYSLRKLITWITLSQPYQLTSMANKTNEKPDADPYFSRVLLKSMTPEQLVDSIFTATNAENTKATDEERHRMYDEWLRDFTVNFGDDEGNETTFNGTVVQALLLMNGNKLNDVIKSKPGSLVKKLDEDRRLVTATKKLDHVFKAVLGRPPTSKEIQLVNDPRKFVVNPKNPSAVWEDIVWALLNSNEFILNH